MSEKLFCIITYICCSVAAIGAPFFGLDAMICLGLCLIPLLLVPLLSKSKS